MLKPETDFLDHFSTLEDPRIERCKLYPMGEVLLLTLCGVICGCDGWGDIEDFGQHKLDFLRRYSPYENGIPSDDTLRRFFRSLCPDKFRECFINWIKSWQIDVATGVIAIDGKQSRHSFDNDKSALHLVSAFASEARVVLGQLATEDKSNEITAISKLLDLLDVTGALVTIDAMGCQHKIAKKIIEGGGDYLLSLKGNQSSLHDDVKAYFSKNSKAPVEIKEHQAVDKGHGRIEERSCKVITDIQWLRDEHPQWPALNSIACISCRRSTKDGQDLEQRYYISSSTAEPNVILAASRSHWSVENNLHWVLDMSFGDDQSRIRKGNAPENMAIVRHIALNLIGKAKRGRESIKRLRKKAGWDNSVLERVIDQNL